jgi:hypothetical protein
LLSTSAERAAIIGELAERNPGMAEIPVELETDDDLRARFETELLNRSRPDRYSRARQSDHLHSLGHSFAA